MPKDLLPASSSAGTTNPISGPATHQGQGSLDTAALNDQSIFIIIVICIPKNKSFRPTPITNLVPRPPIRTLIVLLPDIHPHQPNTTP